jgi:hypothetical protein
VYNSARLSGNTDIALGKQALPLPSQGPWESWGRGALTLTWQPAVCGVLHLLTGSSMKARAVFIALSSLTAGG